MITSGSSVEFTLDDIVINSTGVFENLPPGNHHLRIRDSEGCQRDTILFVPASECNVYIPNIFSPNGDGVNDVFGPLSQSDKTIQRFQIYDRWGGIVFSCDGPIHCEWHGTINDKASPAGVYIYHLIMTSADEVIQRSGTVTLIR